MGRRPKVAKVEEKGHKPKSTTPSLESQPAKNPSLERAELQPERRNPSSERVGTESKIQANSTNLSYSRKKGKKHTGVRRSGRLQNVVLAVKNQHIKPLITEISGSDSEKEDEDEDEPHIHEEKRLPETTLDDKSLEGKTNYLIQLVEALGKTIEALKSKETEKAFQSENSCEADIIYKSLYMDSQKKIEALTDENRQLATKLENALGKLEAYEKGTRAISEVLGKLKDMILVANLSKTAETAVNLSSQAIHGFSSPNTVGEPIISSVKRKRGTDEQTVNTMM